MHLTRKTTIRAAAAVTTLGLIAAGTGMAIAATNSRPNASSSTAWAGMMGGFARGGNGQDFGPGMMGGFGGAAGFMAQGEHMMDAVASYLGLSTSELLTKLQNGSSLADLATAAGKTTDGLKAAITSAITSALQQSTLTAAQQSAILANLSSHLDVMVSAKHAAESFGPRGGFGPGMMGGAGAGFRGMMWGQGSGNQGTTNG